MINKVFNKPLASLISGAVLAGLIALPIQAVAQDKEKERKYDNVKTKQRQAVGSKCAKKLEAAQILIEEEERYQEALGVLRASLDKQCASSYEKAQTLNYIGYAAYSIDDTEGALRAYKRAIAEPDIDERQKVSIRMTLAQLFMMKEDYAAAALQLEAWMRETTLVTDQGKVLLANVYFQLNRKNDSLRLINEVVNAAVAKGQTPKEIIILYCLASYDLFYFFICWPLTE